MDVDAWRDGGHSGAIVAEIALIYRTILRGRHRRLEK
jgi:hypothetical protein